MRLGRDRIPVFALALAVAIPCVSHARVLDVPLRCQEQSNWCWAACSEAVIDYYAGTASQCQIAHQACIRHSPAWCTPCTQTPNYCCLYPSDPSCCNKSNCMYGVGGCIQDLLTVWGINSTGSSGWLSLATIQSELDNCRPFIINWFWTGGGGHYIVGHGVDAGDNIYYMDPWPPGGCAYHIGTYAWMKQGSNHTWEYSLRMTTTHTCWGPDVVVCEPQGGANPAHPPTFWYDVTPVSVGRCDFHVETFDSIAADYSAWVEPAGWSHSVHRSGGKWWVSWWSPGCTNSIFGTFRFQFNNDCGAEWGAWRTTVSGTSDPGAEIVDWSESHTGETSGYGYLVHVPDGTLTDVADREDRGAALALGPGYPTPFSRTVALEVRLPEETGVVVAVYDIRGRREAVLAERVMGPGEHTLTWDGRGENGRPLPPGLYLCRMQAGDSVRWQKLVLVR